ncbi:MAG: response regulator [Bacteroidales bacterium]|nr:response regulator [Bacteroidales bacterium]
MKILAIDDNKDNLISLKAILREAFPEAVLYTANSGPQGIELAQEMDPDVILLDIIMPDMDGYEVCRRLKQDPGLCDIPVVFLTALKECKANRINALNAGAEAFLSKPIDETELTAQVRAMVKIKLVNRQNRNEKEYLAKLVSERTKELEQSQREMMKLLDDLKAENTARKKTEAALLESETHYRTLADSGVVLIWTSDLDQKFDYFNEPWLHFTGRKLSQELGFGWKEVIHPDDLQKIVLDTFNRASERLEKFTMWYRMRHVSGEYRWIQTVGSPRFDRKGSFIGYIGHCLDMTERKQAEDKLRESESRLQDLNATKDKFFSIIAHDLKSPFNSILGFSNILVECIQNKEYAEVGQYAGIIQKSSQRLMALLTNLLEWSRSQTGRMDFSPEYVEIGMLINEAIELSNASAQHKSINIIKRIPSKMITFADKTMISIILRNLISNAIKFTNVGGDISISAEQNEEELMVTVCDNGVGINKEDIEKVFRIDVGYSTLGTQHEEGTGLGLLLCKEFIEKNKGRIWVESEYGIGSKFFFTIPRTLEMLE